ncbi:sulfotransferase family protein [Ghiorsea bivora]|uniref:sulfotransferase family protein n=1 Tax=Ghiorsea bivora TaxID=1485545 RepID=UPI0005700C6B|nr:sulfotransferase family protein [Ghiorsea bivora]
MDIVFVAGLPRSGTTLISGLLQGEEAYPMLPECIYLTRIISLCHKIKTYPDKTRFTSFIKSNEGAYELAHFTGCKVDMDNPYSKRSFEFDKANLFSSVNYGSDITAASLRWLEKDLSEAEVSQVEEMFAGVMAWGNYE